MLYQFHYQSKISFCGLIPKGVSRIYLIVWILASDSETRLYEIQVIRNRSSRSQVFFKTGVLNCRPETLTQVISCKICKFFKVVLSHLKKKLFVCFNESPFKMMRNAFYFILKALFVLKIFKILSWHIGHVEGLIRKIRLISKFLTSQHGKQTIVLFFSKIMQKMRQGD